MVRRVRVENVVVEVLRAGVRNDGNCRRLRIEGRSAVAAGLVARIGHRGGICACKRQVEGSW